jgi:hypothetical protein
MKPSLAKLLLILLPLFLLIIPSANAATQYSYDAAGNLTGASSSPSYLNTLTLGGSPNLTYNGSPFTFDLTMLSLTGYDQDNLFYSISGQTVTWSVTGPAAVSGSTLTVNNSGQVGVTATIGTVVSNTLALTVPQGVLTTLNLSGTPSLIYNGTPLTYNLSNLTLTGADQFGNPYSLSGLSVTWAVTSGPATVSGSTLTITNSGTIGVTASIGAVTSNTLSLAVAQAVLTTLTLSGSPSLAYDTVPLTYNLSNLTLTGADQFGNPYSLSGLSVAWAVVSGPATVSGSTLTITNSGTIGVTARIGTVTSETLSLAVAKGVLTTLTLSGAPSLTYNAVPLTYNLSNLTLTGADQFGNHYSLSGLSVAWAVVSGPATVSGSTLTITNSGTIGVTASIGAVTSSNLTFIVNRANSVLTALTLSGAPSLTYNGTPLAYNLSNLALAGVDQFGSPFSLSGLSVTWAVVSGPATVSGSTLTITSNGTVTVNATIGTIKSNNLALTVTKAAPALATLTLSGSPSLTYYTTSFTYNLSNLTLAGVDQFGNPYSLSGLSVTWAVVSGPATVSGSTLTITSNGTVTVNATIGTVNSNNLGLSVIQALLPPTSFGQTAATVSQISVSWGSETGASSYYLYQNGTYLTSTSGTSYAFTGLSAGTSYTLAVCGLDSRGVPGEQASITGYTLTATPTVTISSVTSSSITVTGYTPLYGASSYNASIWNGSSWVLNNSTIETTSYTFSGLMSGITYTLGIAGVNAAGASGAVGQNSATTNGSQTFSTPGSSTFTAPAGVNQLYVELWGAGGGGGGGGYYSPGYNGGGGGGGSYMLFTMPTSPGNNYSVTVGKGGNGASGTGVAGSSGGPSSFGTVASAAGGLGGGYGTTSAGGAGGNGSNGAAGGASTLNGSSGSSYSTTVSGGTLLTAIGGGGGGSPGYCGNGGGLGGIGGSGGSGGSGLGHAGGAGGGGGGGGGNESGAGGTAGSFPAGGGGGGNDTPATGGAGANGDVIVWW